MGLPSRNVERYSREKGGGALRRLGGCGSIGCRGNSRNNIEPHNGGGLGGHTIKKALTKKTNLPYPKPRVSLTGEQKIVRKWEVKKNVNRVAPAGSARGRLPEKNTTRRKKDYPSRRVSWRMQKEETTVGGTFERAITSSWYREIHLG